VRSLDEHSLGLLVSYEEQHAAGAPVLMVLRQRLAAVRTGAERSDCAPSSQTRPEARRSG
jgi:hypothetical protein